MRWIYILLTSAYALIFVISLISSSTPSDAIVLRDWTVAGKSFRVPFKMVIEDATLLRLESEFYSDESTKAYLVLPRILTQGMRVYVNGEMFFNILVENEYANIWTTTFQAEIHVKRGRNVIQLELQNLYDLKMRWPLYITFKPTWRVDVSNIISNFMPALSAGLSFSLGIFLMILSYKRKRSYYTYFAHVFSFMALYLLDMAHIPIEMNSLSFKLIKRIYFFSLHGTLALFPIGIDVMFEGRIRRSSRILGYGLVVLGMIVLFHPNFHTARMIHLSSGPYFLLMTFVIFLKLLGRENILAFSAMIMFISSVQHALASIGMLPIPSILGFGLLYVLWSFMYFLTIEYRKIESDLLKARRELFIDPLTGAYNRRMLEILDLDENDSIVFFDFDDFKKINDEFGHAYGDEVLKEFVEVSKGTIRKGDMVIRYGGDEFILVLKDCDEDKALSIAEMISKNFTEKTGVSASYGVSSIGKAPIEALAEADFRMYDMKRKKKESGYGKREG